MFSLIVHNQTGNLQKKTRIRYNSGENQTRKKKERPSFRMVPVQKGYRD